MPVHTFRSRDTPEHKLLLVYLSSPRSRQPILSGAGPSPRQGERRWFPAGTATERSVPVARWCAADPAPPAGGRSLHREERATFRFRPSCALSRSRTLARPCWNCDCSTCRFCCARCEFEARHFARRLRFPLLPRLVAHVERDLRPLVLHLQLRSGQIGLRERHRRPRVRCENRESCTSIPAMKLLR